MGSKGEGLCREERVQNRALTEMWPVKPRTNKTVIWLGRMTRGRAAGRLELVTPWTGSPKNIDEHC
jgi:hypothetical protein